MDKTTIMMEDGMLPVYGRDKEPAGIIEVIIVILYFVFLLLAFSGV